ncbi:hypothetical protein EOM09_01900 [bacterium]|nr:hypothetical protein [bacterium]
MTKAKKEIKKTKTTKKIYVGAIILIIIFLLIILIVNKPTYNIKTMYDCQEDTKYKLSSAVNTEINDIFDTKVKYVKLERDGYNCIATAVFKKPIFILGTKISSYELMTCNIKGFKYMNDTNSLNDKEIQKLFAEENWKWCESNFN